jgi:hypothetical protein
VKAIKATSILAHLVNHRHFGSRRDGHVLSSKNVFLHASDDYCSENRTHVYKSVRFITREGDLVVCEKESSSSEDPLSLLIIRFHMNIRSE